MVEQTYFTGPVDSWLTSFGSWAANNPDYRSVDAVALEHSQRK